MSALFDFRSFCVVVLLMICTCTYIKLQGRNIPFLSRRGWLFARSSRNAPLAFCRQLFSVLIFSLQLPAFLARKQGE